MENTIRKSDDIIFKEIKKQLLKFFNSNDLVTYNWERVTIGFGLRKTTLFNRLLHYNEFNEFGLLYTYNIREKNIKLKSYREEFTEMCSNLNLNIFGEPYSVTIIEDFND